MIVPQSALLAEFVNRDKPSMARVYDYLLGGKDHWGVDRVTGDEMCREVPGLRTMVRVNRHFLSAATAMLVSEFEVSQFLDVGSGIPSTDSLHGVAQGIDPAARIVYVDCDPLVAAHMHAVAVGCSTKAGRIAFIHADARQPRQILDAPEFATTLDPQSPVALMLVSMLMYFPLDVAQHIVRSLMDALPPRSYLVISHPTADFDEEGTTKAAVDAARRRGLTYHLRPRDEVATLFEGLELTEPGVVPMVEWLTLRKPPRIGTPDTTQVYYYVGIGQKPKTAGFRDQ